MKLALDDRMKHLLAGIVVIIAMSIIFLPDLLKNSSKIEDKFNLSLRLPHKPALPKVAIPNQQSLFKTIKVAHVNIPSIPKPQHPVAFAKAQPLAPKPSIPNPTLAQLEPLPVVKNTPPTPNTTPAIAIVKNLTPSAAKIVQTPVHINTHIKQKTAHLSTNITKQIAVNTGIYKVQLAAFGQEKNAIAMVKKLKRQGYVASYYKNGVLYHVLVGNAQQKVAAIQLQHQLATRMQVNGLITKQG